jgi:DNA-binding SARP family transcriptional activator/tetratricopeptide (TPR) repeat protein
MSRVVVASIGLLGPVEARSADGASIHLGPLRQRAMLAILALRPNAPVSPELLIEVGWGDHPPVQARQHVHTHICRLRRALQPEAPRWSRHGLLSSTAEGYVLSLCPDALDVTRFEQLFERAQTATANRSWESAMVLFDQALRCWRGPPLAGLSAAALQAERRRLEERRLSACQRRLAVAVRLGRHDSAVAELSTLVAEDPLREPMVELLMLAQYRGGRQADALRTYVATRRLLIEELGVEPGAGLQRLHLQILRKDPVLTADALAERPLEVPTNGTTSVAAPPSLKANRLPVPRQLPPDIVDFVGRAAEIDQLTRALTGDGSSSGLRCVALTGPAGVGKSTLAVHLAHRLRSRFPNGQLYVDLCGDDRRTADPSDVLASFLRALDVPADAIPESSTERASLFRSMLSGRRVLVLLDNARNSRQLSALMPGTAQCAVIATSRGRLDLAGIRSLDLDPLPAADAVGLVAAVVGAERVAQEPRATEVLVDACERLPLAVRIAATRLAARRSWTIRSMCDRLARSSRLNELALAHVSVRASFQLSYEQLTPAAARAFRLLSLVASPDISVAAAAASLDIPVDAAERLLESLVDDALLSSPALGRYLYHDLLKLFAKELADADGPEAAAVVDRWVAYHTRTAFAADRTLRPTVVRELANAVPDESPAVFADRGDAARWFSTELTSTAAVITTASTGSASVAADVLEIVGDRWLENGCWEESAQAAASLLRAAIRDRDSQAEACARRVLGYVSGRRRRPAEADEHFALGLVAARRTESALLEARMLSMAACTDVESRRFTRAIGRYSRARSLCRTGELARGEAMVVADLAYAHLKRRDHDAAITHARHGLRLNTRLGETEIQALCLDVLGSALEASGRSAEGASYLHEALALCRSIQLRYAEAHVLTALGRLHHSRGEGSTAAAMCEEALSIRVDLNYVLEQQETLAELSRIFADRGETARAELCRRRADQLWSSDDEPGAPD